MVPQRSLTPNPGPAQDDPQESHHVPVSIVQINFELFRLGAVTISLSSLFQCPTTLLEPFSNIQPELPYHNFRPFPQKKKKKNKTKN